MRPDFITGAIDLHIHSGPDVVSRIGTSVDIARAAAASGMRAIVLKDHLFPSWTKAAVTDQVVDGIQVYGGITLNSTTGGLNVRAVKASIAGGARVMMFPSFDTIRYFNRPKKSSLQLGHGFGEPMEILRATDDSGNVLPDAHRILEVVAENPLVILSNGHLGPEEALPLFREAKNLGISRMMIEHPNGAAYWEIEHLQELTELGAVLNLAYNSYQPIMGRRSFEEIIAIIEAVGVQHLTLITDGGQPYNPMPNETLRVFSEMLFHEGVPADDIMTMTKVTPTRVLECEPLATAEAA